MANDNLGDITCGGCDNSAHIRQQKTGKKLLYLYCPNCGMDKRSGAKLQAKWQAAIDGVSPPVPSKNEKPSNEWQPNQLDKVDNENEQSKERNNSETNGNGIRNTLAGLGIFGILGLVWRASRV